MFQPAGDSGIRTALKQSLHQGDADGVLIDELPICRGVGRADVAFANGSLSGYEIKSAADSLKRLPSQVELYDKVFDFSTAVVAEKHLAGARKILPKHWGIQVAVECSEGITIKPVRRAKRNHRTESSALTRLLWHKEARKALKKQGLDASASLLISDLWQLMLANLPRDLIAEEVRTALKARGGCEPVQPQTPSDGSCTTDSTAQHCLG